MTVETITTINGEDLALAMSQAVSRVDRMTHFLYLVYLATMLIFVLIEARVRNSTSTKTTLLIHLIGSVDGLIILGWIYSINAVVYWVRPDGTVDSHLKAAVICLGIMMTGCIIYDAYRFHKLPAEIPVLILDPSRLRGYKATGDQPFVYPYREGTGEGAKHSSDTDAVISGNEP